MYVCMYSNKKSAGCGILAIRTPFQTLFPGNDLFARELKEGCMMITTEILYSYKSG